MAENNEKQGTVKTSWHKIRARVAAVEPEFAALVDQLDPGEEYPVYLLYFPYGAMKGDTISPFIPRADGSFYRLSDPEAPKEIVKDLGYGMYDSPFGMVLEKQFEFFCDLPESSITIPKFIYKPGSFFSFLRNLGKRQGRQYAPNKLFSTVAGARSVFMLPKIGDITHHSRLQADLNIKSSSAKIMYDHWSLFKEISHSSVSDCTWRACLMYFSKPWLDKLHNDDAWEKLKLYLQNIAWDFFQYDIVRTYYDIIFSLVQKKRNLKPNPYLVDTARHLFTIALGDAPAYTPACSEEGLPLYLLQRVFVESYGLKKYYPTIMQAENFRFEQDQLPIYYSLQHPSTYLFSPKSCRESSAILELRELEHITSIFAEELTKEQNACSDTILAEIAQKVQFRYFHNGHDRHKVAKLASEMPNYDSRLIKIKSEYKLKKAKFACDAPFVRGCVSLSTKTVRD